MMSYKNILLNSVLLIFVELLIIALLHNLINIWILDTSSLTLIGRIKEVLGSVVVVFFYGVISKVVLELIPKLLIQYFLIRKYHKQLQMLKLWTYFFVLGIIVFIFWWSDSHFSFKYNFIISIAIYNLFAIAVSPFVLKKLGWDILEKAAQLKLDEQVK
jgi:hypothetical protein